MAIDIVTCAPTMLEAARDLRAALATFEPGNFSAEDCALFADELSMTEKACAAARTLSAARAVASGAHRERGFADPTSWLSHQAGATSRQAKDTLRLAASLETCPLTKEALLKGEVSIAQAEEIVRCVADLPETEEDFLQLARHSDLTKVRDEARDRRLASTKPEDLHRRQHEARRFRHWKDELGMVRIDGALPPETGIPLVNRIERDALRLRVEAKRGGDPEPFTAYAADALVALAAGVGTGGSTKTDLVIVCDLFAWRRGHTHTGEACHIIGGGPIPVDLAKELSKDAFLKCVLHDGVNIQLVSHQGRKCTAELRTALDLGAVPSFRGRACVDCGRTWGLEHDHTDPIAHTGPTSITNMKDRCWPCHAEKTERDRRAGLLGNRARSRKGRQARSTATEQARRPARPAQAPDIEGSTGSSRSTPPGRDPP